MRFLKVNTEAEANTLNGRVTQSCLEAGVWSNGTNNYCNPEHQEFWLVPVLEGYEQFFTPAELAGIDEDEQQLADDKAKGRRLIDTYLLDNKKINLTTQQSLQQLQKFSAIKGLLESGALDAAKELIELSLVDEIFTQERKDKYITALT
jgi:hypothetical protein